jgi:hypothetical protein
MPKSLGQIHNVKETATVTVADQGAPLRRIDLSGLLTTELQRMVRSGNFFKMVGIDISVIPNVLGAADGASVSGYIRYYTPTRGRCAAFRHAFKSCADLMESQGIPMRLNAGYDFRPALSSNVSLQNTLKNQATLDGVTGLALNHSVPGSSVFGVYNKSIKPTIGGTVADLFDEGFDTILAAGGAKTDFVLNEAAIYTGNEEFADLGYSEIPFSISNTPGNRTLTFNWRPDPALYVAVLAGQMEVVIEEVDVRGAAVSALLSVNVMVSGWKSIMGNPDKKKSSSKKRTRK